MMNERPSFPDTRFHLRLEFGMSYWEQIDKSTIDSNILYLEVLFETPLFPKEVRVPICPSSRGIENIESVAGCWRRA
jgi:hypothetical protein